MWKRREIRSSSVLTAQILLDRKFPRQCLLWHNCQPGTQSHLTSWREGEPGHKEWKLCRDLRSMTFTWPMRIKCVGRDGAVGCVWVSVCFTYEEVQHHFLTRNGVTLVQTVGSASQPGYPVSRYLYQFHQRSDAPPGRVLAGTHSHPLGKPQVDGEERAERYAQERGVETYAILLWQPLTTRRAGGGAGAPSTSGALRGSETGGGRVGTLPLKQVRLGRRTVQRLRQRYEVAAAARTAKHRASTATTWSFSFRRGHFISLWQDRTTFCNLPQWEMCNFAR